MVKVERSFPAPASLALESQKANGSYSMPDVVKQLKEDFHNTGISLLTFLSMHFYK